MVKLHDTPALPEPTLDAIWQTTARRASPRQVAACLTLGILGLAALRFVDQLRMPGLIGLVIGAFGLYALAVQPTLGGRVFRSRTLRALAAIAVAIAILASAAVGLLVLAAIFGGKIEVMRR